MQVAMLLLLLALSMCGQLYKHENRLPVLTPWVTSGSGQLVALFSYQSDLTSRCRAPPFLWGWAKILTKSGATPAATSKHSA